MNGAIVTPERYFRTFKYLRQSHIEMPMEQFSEPENEYGERVHQKMKVNFDTCDNCYQDQITPA